MPRPIGQAVSIVGALVLGEAAVQAGLISNTMVIVVALTAIASFVLVPLGDSIIILRIFFALSAMFMGLFGILAGMILVLVHLAKLRSFGVPYLYPVAPGNVQGLKDVLIKAPVWSMQTRPALLTPLAGRRRVAKAAKPKNERSQQP